MVTKTVDFFGDYKLRYGWEGIEALTTALDAEAFSDFENIVSKLGPKHLRIIVWAGLIDKYPSLQANSKEMYTIMDDYLEGHDIAALSDIVGKALLASGIISSGQGDDMGEETTTTPKPQRRSRN